MSSLRPQPSYAAVLREPHAPALFAAALLGRLSYGILFVALTVALTQASGSYAWAGTAIALFGLSGAFLAPARAALIDRYGSWRALLPMTVAYATLLGCLTVATWRPNAPHWGLLTLTLLTGACAPPLGPVTRSVWSDLFSDRGELRQRAFSLDAVAEELLYVTGPLIAGLFIAFGNPAAGVATSALLVLVGTVGMSLNPALRRAMSKESQRAARSDRPAAPLPTRWLRDPALSAAAVGFTLGALNLLLVAFAEQHRQLAAVSWLEAAVSVGSAVGGIAYGARAWRLSGRARIPLLTLGLSASLALAGLSPNLYVLAVGVAVVGLFIAPALATAYLTADESAPTGGQTLAGTWVNSAHNAGSAAGTAAVGLLLSGLPLAACFALASLPTLAATVVALTGVRHHQPPPPVRTTEQELPVLDEPPGRP